MESKSFRTVSSEKILSATQRLYSIDLYKLESACISRVSIRDKFHKFQRMYDTSHEISHGRLIHSCVLLLKKFISAAKKLILLILRLRIDFDVTLISWYGDDYILAVLREL